MAVRRESWSGDDPRGFAAKLRALQPAPGEVADAVAELIAAVRNGGDDAVRELEVRFGGSPGDSLLVPTAEIEAAHAGLDAELLEALEVAAKNVRAVAGADSGSPAELELEEGQQVSIREVPVAAAGAYAPGGVAAYPSSAIMCCVPAVSAGVDRVALATPTGPDGRIGDVSLAAASIAGATEVYAMGGVQAIAALALGTETIDPVDVVVGPGNRFVQEAKRQLVGTVGIDGIAGPSEVMVILDFSADLHGAALDLLAQAEHGSDGLLVAASPDSAVLDELEAKLAALAVERPSVNDAPTVFVETPSLEVCAELADALAPEHLEVACAGARDLAATVRYAGCIFIGEGGATAFGDYVAGSNHVLPTGGAGRFTGPLGPGVFRRRQATVEIDPAAAQKLAPAAARLARAEGFPVHGESAEARAKEQS